MSSFQKISWFGDNYRISAHGDFSEHILGLRQLPEFISMSIFNYLRTNVTKQDFFNKVKYKQNRKQKHTVL